MFAKKTTAQNDTIKQREKIWVTIFPLALYSRV